MARYKLERQIETREGEFVWANWGTFDTVEGIARACFEIGKNMSNIEDVRVIEIEVDNHKSKRGYWRDNVGEWIEGERNAPEYITGQMVDLFACSWCGYTMYYKTPFCPNCGTPMDTDEEPDLEKEIIKAEYHHEEGLGK